MTNETFETLKMTIEQLEQSYLIDTRLGNQELWEKEFNDALIIKEVLEKAAAFSGFVLQKKSIMQALKC